MPLHRLRPSVSHACLALQPSILPRLHARFVSSSLESFSDSGCVLDMCQGLHCSQFWLTNMYCVRSRLVRCKRQRNRLHFGTYNRDISFLRAAFSSLFRWIRAPVVCTASVCLILASFFLDSPVVWRSHVSRLMLMSVDCSVLSSVL